MKICCYIPFGAEKDIRATVKELRSSELVKKIYITGSDTAQFPVEGTDWLPSGPLTSGKTLAAIAQSSDADFTLIYLRQSPLKLGQSALERFVGVARDTGAGLVYSNYYAVRGGTLTPNPVIDYQEGSLRDDFNFGSLLLYRTSVLREALLEADPETRHAGLYALRLNSSLRSTFFRIPEYLYTEQESDLRLSGEKIFDYVDPKNRMVQVEMEEVCTHFLKKAGAYLEPSFKAVDFGATKFPVEASVIIPVRNRVKTIEDAIRSVLSQKTDFPFNLIIADNHSTDGTTEIISAYAAQDPRLIHLIPGRTDLGIGGCWNAAVDHPACGKFAVQLDSDDLYLDETTLQQVVQTFYAEKCAMVVGSYRMVNFALEEIPPGVIDHREWTPENGRNNALRINGLGAPRAFFTPLLREIRVPNVSYGEDYAVGLAISRAYQIGRIYNPIYLCRRWDDNSDASLSIEVMNNHNLYKDRIRTIEFLARKQLNKSKQA
ncbi:MAG: glycosyltransferase family 2 protein [Marinilabiliales bacterium]|nr:glycosyltransferase family 2 protein [Marinilabiliales bacterium]